jgi:hypothetical protein
MRPPVGNGETDQNQLTGSPEAQTQTNKSRAEVMLPKLLYLLGKPYCGVGMCGKSGKRMNGTGRRMKKITEFISYNILTYL